MKVSIINFDTQYLAHPVEFEEEAKTVEQKLRAIGIDVLNPLKEERAEDKYKRSFEDWFLKPHAPEEAARLVERDLDWIKQCDGLFAFVPEPHGFGTMMEIFYAAKVLDKPVFVYTSPKYRHHPFLTYFGQVFTDMDFALATMKFRKQIEGFPFHIALGGKMGTGKSTASDFLVKTFQFKRYSFAAKLKEIASDLFGMEQKNRELLQVLGSKLRELDRDVWIDAVMRQIETDKPNRAVIDDMRYLNEARLMKTVYHWFDLVKLECANREDRGIIGLNDGTRQHPSELEIDQIEADYTVNTDCSIEEMYVKIMEVLGKIANRPFGN